jgi:guanylate kinase
MNGKKWEQDGIEYFFRGEDEILADIKAGRFVEAELIHNQQVSGINARELERAYHHGHIPINDVDIEGGINVAKLKPDAITICVLPPSFDAWISRMRGRSDFKPDELHRRLQQATKVFRLALSYNHFVFVINDKLEEAIQAVDDIATKGVHHAEDEKHAHDLAAQLYHQTVKYLKENAPDVLPA